MSKRLYIVWIGLIVMVMGTFLYLGMETKEQNKNYVKLENELEEAAGIYMSDKNLNVVSGESQEIDIDDLLKEGYIDSISVDKDKCEGLVIIDNNHGKITYKADISCGNYESLKN